MAVPFLSPFATGNGRSERRRQQVRRVRRVQVGAPRSPSSTAEHERPETWAGRSRPPARTRSGRRARRARRPAAAKPSAVTSSGAAGSSTAASTPSDTTTASGAMPSHGVAQPSSAASHGSSPDPGGIGSLTVAPAPSPPPTLVGVSDEVREPSGRRIDVDARVEDVAALPEDLLRAVALVGVDVDDRDAFDAAVAQPLGGGRGVVEVARPAVERGPGVVTRRAHRGVRRPPARRARGRWRGRRRGRRRTRRRTCPR